MTYQLEHQAVVELEVRLEAGIELQRDAKPSREWAEMGEQALQLAQHRLRTEVLSLLFKNLLGRATQIHLFL